MPLAPLPRHHQSGGLQEIGADGLGGLQVSQQTVPAIRGVAELEAVDGRLFEAPGLAQIGQRRSTVGLAQLAAELSTGQGQHPMERLPP